MGFLELMRERNLVAQVTHEEELTEHLSSGVRTAYVGFDPTADSLHAGSLMPVMALVRWQQAGHRVIAVVGGGTGLIGDPSGKTDMRQMLTPEGIKKNLAGIRRQLEKFLDLSTPSKGIIVDNADWLTKLEYLPFLRDIGRHFSVNRMLTAECFKNRLEKGLSFLEFNYMLLQSYDFLHLFKQEQCSVQLGGDDQWSNMLSGVDLVRRLTSGKAFCVTTPLLTRPDGGKMGKTEKGAVWLDPEKTSPFEYFQYWRNVEDVMVGPCLRYFTHLPMSEVRRLEALPGAEINEAKKILAFECTRLLHGDTEAGAARESAAALFASGGPAGVGGSGSEPQLEISAAAFGDGMLVSDLLVTVGALESKGEVKRLIQQGGIAINGKKVDDMAYKVTLAEFDEGSCLVKKGKKHYYRIRIS